MEQYYQFLFKEVAQQSTQDANGNWVKPEGTTIEYVGKCRYEINGKGAVINGNDGLHVAYSGIIYTPVTTWRALDGQMLIVSSDRLCNDVLAKVKLVSADYGRLHTRLWVE